MSQLVLILIAGAAKKAFWIRKTLLWQFKEFGKAGAEEKDCDNIKKILTLSWQRLLSYRNQWTGFYIIMSSVMKGLRDYQQKTFKFLNRLCLLISNPLPLPPSETAFIFHDPISWFYTVFILALPAHTLYILIYLTV